MATKTRRRQPRQRKGAEPKSLGGKETWLVVDSNGNAIHENGWSEGAALVRAQRFAEQAKDPVEYEIQWKGLFGEPQPLSRVWRDECGIVFTLPV